MQKCGAALSATYKKGKAHYTEVSNEWLIQQSHKYHRKEKPTFKTTKPPLSSRYKRI
jgi:hypothetical protein